jgi:hypothetical protein
MCIPFFCRENLAWNWVNQVTCGRNDLAPNLCEIWHIVPFLLWDQYVLIKLPLLVGKIKKFGVTFLFYEMTSFLMLYLWNKLEIRRPLFSSSEMGSLLQFSFEILGHFWREKLDKNFATFGRKNSKNLTTFLVEKKNWKTQLGLLILVSLGSLGLFFMRWDGVHSSSCKMESSLVRWRPLWLGSAINLTPYSLFGNTFGLWHWTDCNIYWRALFYAAIHCAS